MNDKQKKFLEAKFKNVAIEILVTIATSAIKPPLFVHTCTHPSFCGSYSQHVSFPGNFWGCLKFSEAQSDLHDYQPDILTRDSDIE